TDIRQRQHVKKIKDQHLALTEFQQGMSLEEVARQFGFVRASDQTFIRTVDDTPSGRPAVDVIEPLAGPAGPWEHRLGTDTLNRVRGHSPKEVFDHLDFVASDYHDGLQ